MRGTVSRAEAQAKLDGIKAKPWFKYLYMGETFRDREVSGWRKEIENDPLVNLKAVTVPTLILYGADDAVVSVADSVERFKDVAPHMSNVDVPVIARAAPAIPMSEVLKTSLAPTHYGNEWPELPAYLARRERWLAP